MMKPRISHDTMCCHDIHNRSTPVNSTTHHPISLIHFQIRSDERPGANQSLASRWLTVLFPSKSSNCCIISLRRKFHSDIEWNVIKILSEIGVNLIKNNI